MVKTIMTARLRLRPCEPGDIDVLHQLWIDPVVRRYLWDDSAITREQAAAVVASSLEHWSTYGYGQWVMLQREHEKPIGFCGFRPAEWTPHPELLYGLAPSYWKQGLATEAVTAILQFGFETLGFDRVVAATDVPNTASVRVMEKAEMAFERRGMLNGLHTLFYSISSADFQRATR